MAVGDTGSGESLPHPLSLFSGGGGSETPEKATGESRCRPAPTTPQEEAGRWGPQASLPVSCPPTHSAHPAPRRLRGGFSRDLRKCHSSEKRARTQDAGPPHAGGAPAWGAGFQRPHSGKFRNHRSSSEQSPEDACAPQSHQQLSTVYTRRRASRG